MNCNHEVTRTIPTPDLPHHGKIICSLCGKFMGWAKKPATIEREQRNAAAIVRLRFDKRLTEWEKEFIASIEGQGPKLSPKQQETLEKIAANYV